MNRSMHRAGIFMRPLVLLLALPAAGCAGRAHQASARLVIPLSCITRISVDRTQCVLLSETEAECKGVVVSVACLQAVPPKKEQEKSK